ncbi:hypothetical protein [Leekyejoonella antrihumi]|nr:hypothetical protein [Leekyejoonella antrihumi]
MRSKKEMIEVQARFWVLMAQGSTLQAGALSKTDPRGRPWCL